MVTEIRGSDITSNKDRYFLEKAIERARERFQPESDRESSKESLGRRNNINFRVDAEATRKRKSKLYIFAAIAVGSNGKRTVTGYNSYNKTHPKQKRYSIRNGESPDRCYTHAEIHAISKLHGADAIYIARVDNRGNTNLAKPCRACRAAIEDSGIKKVVYT